MVQVTWTVTDNWRFIGTQDFSTFWYNYTLSVSIPIFSPRSWRHLMSYIPGYRTGRCPESIINSSGLDLVWRGIDTRSCKRADSYIAYAISMALYPFVASPRCISIFPLIQSASSSAWAVFPSAVTKLSILSELKNFPLGEWCSHFPAVS